MQYLAIDPGKRCTQCYEHKPLTEFNRQLEGYRTVCRQCTKANGRHYNSKTYNSGKERARKLQQNYGLSLYQYEELYDAQSGLCAICFEDGHLLDVDHCHESKKVRGLLCRRCNLMLGKVKDNTSILKNAIDYLEK